MIPKESLEAVKRGVREAFGVDEIEDALPITKGHSGALIYRIVVKGTPCLLRIITRRGDPTQADHFECMKIAAEGGIAPRVWYTSTEDHLAITDFVNSTPFSMTEALERMPHAMRKLHELPEFPRRADHLNTTCTFLLQKTSATEVFLQRVRAAKLFREEEGPELFARYEQLVVAYSTQESDRVSCHNDLFKPDNILCDGNRVWLVDWEAAFLNDRYADLAVVANMMVTDDEEERLFLDRYLGEPANGSQLARFYLMRQLAHLFYAVAFLFQGSMEAPIHWSEAAPTLGELRERFWLGEMLLVDRSAKICYGRAHLEAFLRKGNGVRFREALKMVASGGQTDS